MKKRRKLFCPSLREESPYRNETNSSITWSTKRPFFFAFLSAGWENNYKKRKLRILRRACLLPICLFGICGVIITSFQRQRKEGRKGIVRREKRDSSRQILTSKKERKLSPSTTHRQKKAAHHYSIFPSNAFVKTRKKKANE